MIVTVFRSRPNPATATEYIAWNGRMSALAHTMPGHVSHKSFRAEDGEWVTVVEFETEAHVRAWAAHPQHLEAQALGRSQFLTEYRIQICQVMRQSHHP